jgi:hypothetical protein
MRLLLLLLPLLAGAATGAPTDDAAHRPPHPAGVSALKCGSATYKCAPSASADASTIPALASVCVNLCIKGAEPPKAPVPDGACGPPCTFPAEACVLAARAAATHGGRAPGVGVGGESADDGGSVLPALPLTHADFEARFEGLRPAGQACPLVVE